MDNQGETSVHPLLYHHVQALRTKGYVVVGIGPRPALSDLRSQIVHLRPDWEIVDVEVERGTGDNQQVREHMDAVKRAIGGLATKHAVAFLADYALPDIMYLHKVSSPCKMAGMIVVSCFGRPVFWKKPTNTEGVTYPGIFFRAGQLAASLPCRGDYLEFGVFDGRTMTLAWHMVKHIAGMRFFGFDSFSGIIGSAPRESRTYADGTFFSNLPTFYHNMKVAGVDPQRYIPVKGNFLEFFQDPKALQKKLAIRRCLVAHIDCDVYAAAKASLDFLTDVIVQGSVLLFDEFHANSAANDAGERRALTEWLEENPHIQVERWHDYTAVSRAFIVHVRDKSRRASHSR